MPRILTRPMFRKGGLSQTARPTYQGGGVTAIRPRYRNGGLNGIMSGIVPRRGYQLGTGDALGGSWAVGPKVEGPEWHEDIYISPITGTLRKKSEEEQFVSPARPHKDIITPSQEHPKIEIKTDTPSISDEETMESYMKMFEKAAGTDPDEAKRSKWLELAKFGANVLGQPGGDLTGAIGKAAAPSIEGLGKTMAEDRAGKRQLRIAGLSAYLKGKDPGAIGKAVKDIMAANKNLSKQEALTLALRSGTATRESTAESKTQDIATSLYKDGFVESKTKARGAATALQDSIEQGVPSTRYKKLPEDKDDRKDGAYYIDPKTGVLGRYNKSTGEIIEPGDPGFKPKKK